MTAGRTVFRHQRNYLNKVVADLWKEHELSSVQIIRESGKLLRIAGDARCDSMGHSEFM